MECESIASVPQTSTFYHKLSYDKILMMMMMMMMMMIIIIIIIIIIFCNF